MTTKALRTDVTNGVEFLNARPLWMGYNLTSPPSVPANSGVNVPFDADVIDNWNGHSPATDNTVYLCQCPGWYWTCAVVYWQYTTSTNAMFEAELATSFFGSAGVSLGGEQRVGGNGYAPCLMAADLLPLGTVNTDYIRVVAKNLSSSAVSLGSAFPVYSYVSSRWVAAQAGTDGTEGLTVPANPAWPSPPSYVTSAFLNTNIRDALGFLTYPPVFRGFLATTSGPGIPSQTFPAGSVVSLDTTTGGTTSGGVAVDNYSGWQSGSQAWKAPVAGVYTVFGQVGVSAGGGILAVGYSVNGGTVTWMKCIYDTLMAGSPPPCINGVHRVRLNAGDQVQLYVSQSCGNTVSLVGSGSTGAFTKLVIFWESA